MNIIMSYLLIIVIVRILPPILNILKICLRPIFKLIKFVLTLMLKPIICVLGIIFLILDALFGGAKGDYSGYGCGGDDGDNY